MSQIHEAILSDRSSRSIAETGEREPTPETHVKGIHLTLTRALGMYGAAYDPPGPHRAYTYEHQPANGLAWNLGRAVSALQQCKPGDAIDTGLYLLKEMQVRGLGIFEIEPKAVEPPPQTHLSCLTSQSAPMIGTSLFDHSEGETNYMDDKIKRVGTNRAAKLQWEENSIGWVGYSGGLAVGTVSPKPDGSAHYNASMAVVMKGIANAQGQTKNVNSAKAAVERAWSKWLKEAGLQPREPDKP